MEHGSRVSRELLHGRIPLADNVLAPSLRPAKQGNIISETMFLVMFPGVAKLGNICFEREICVRKAKMFWTLFSQHMFPARLNWETFASASMFPQQCFLI